MLVLSRKEEETIVIDDRITIRFLRVKGRTVRVGISAPRDVPVRRGELKPMEEKLDLGESGGYESNAYAADGYVGIELQSSRVA